jgi:hypothetical protein
MGVRHPWREGEGEGRGKREEKGGNERRDKEGGEKEGGGRGEGRGEEEIGRWGGESEEGGKREEETGDSCSVRKGEPPCGERGRGRGRGRGKRGKREAGKEGERKGRSVWCPGNGGRVERGRKAK